MTSETVIEQLQRRFGVAVQAGPVAGDDIAKWDGNRRVLTILPGTPDVDREWVVLQLWFLLTSRGSPTTDTPQTGLPLDLHS